MTEENKFKEGDIVKFKSPNSHNACYFKRTGLDNLKIISLPDKTTCYVQTKDKSDCFFVNPKELELQTPPKIFIFKKKNDK